MLEAQPDAPGLSMPRPSDAGSSSGRARRSRWALLMIALVTILVVIEAVLASVIAAKIRDGASVLAFEAEGGVPARLYMPFDKDDQPFDARHQDERPPVLVLGHGFTGDQNSLRLLATRVADAGYAVITFDFAGHGSNRNPFPAGGAGLDGDVGAIVPDIGAVVDWAEASGLVDAERLAVAGHSMGAAAAFEFANTDPRPDAVIPIAGAGLLRGKERPKNALFIVAEGDPPATHDRVDELASLLAGDAVTRGATQGDVSDGTAIRAVTIPRTGHVDVIGSPRATREIVAWLDGTFARSRPAGVRISADPITGLFTTYSGIAILLVAGLAWLAGKLAPSSPIPPSAGAARRMLVLAVALSLAVVFAGLGAPTELLPLVTVNTVVGWLLMAAGIVFVLRAVVARFGVSWPSTVAVGVGVGPIAGWPSVPGPWRSKVRPLLLPTLMVAGGLYGLLAAGAPAFHRLTPTPQRLVALVLTFVLALPFNLIFEHLVRRGTVGVSIGLTAAGRAIQLLILTIGVGTGLVPSLVFVALAFVAVGVVVVEAIAIPIYATSRNVVLIAVIETLLFAWFAAITFPITL